MKGELSQAQLKDRCIECGSENCTERTVMQQFPYGVSDDQVILSASFPVVTCSECGYQSFDERGEAARFAAICRHHGVHSPEERQKMRQLVGLSRSEFCELSGFGPASLQRWENGTIIPNLSSDRLTYLMQYPDNVLRLRQLTIGKPVREDTAQAGQPLGFVSVATREPVLEVPTRCTTRRFTRFGGRTRTLQQASGWSLRAR